MSLGNLVESAQAAEPAMKRTGSTHWRIYVAATMGKTGWAHLDLIADVVEEGGPAAPVLEPAWQQLVKRELQMVLDQLQPVTSRCNLEMSLHQVVGHPNHLHVVVHASGGAKVR